MKPCTEFSGVRSSCETIETKLERTLLATLSAETSRALNTTMRRSPALIGVTPTAYSAEKSGKAPQINSSLGMGAFFSKTRVRGQLEVPHKAMRLRFMHPNTLVQC